jgi:hypothetical protein
MSIGHCSCPECGTILRVRDRSFIGRQIECPDCQIQLVISLNDERKLAAERPKAEPKAPPFRLAIPVASVGSAIGQKVSGIARSPLAVAWALAIGLTAFAGILMLRPAVRFRTPTGDGSRGVAINPAVEPVPDPVLMKPNPESPPTDATATTSPVSSGKSLPDSTIPATRVAGPVESPTPQPSAVTDPPSGNPPKTDPPQADPAPVAAVPTKTVPLAPVPAKIDVEELLKQRLQKFETSQPITRQHLIELVEELVGVPIRYDREELGEKNLERTISINLETTTVGGVLKVLLDAAGWEYVVEGNSLRLKPRQVAGTSSR